LINVNGKRTGQAYQDCATLYFQPECLNTT
jgi:hypothetical protein